MTKKKVREINPNNVVGLDLKPYRKLPFALEATQMLEPFVVITTKGERLIGKAGDYFVQGKRGCIYPVDKDIFEELHREIEK